MPINRGRDAIGSLPCSQLMGSGTIPINRVLPYPQLIGVNDAM
ncbi:MAG TPA: hypothetical protein VII61_18370 [Ktedonobacteraceae bacterium]